jgi:hypothetical protein
MDASLANPVPRVIFDLPADFQSFRASLRAVADSANSVQLVNAMTKALDRIDATMEANSRISYHEYQAYARVARMSNPWAVAMISGDIEGGLKKLFEEVDYSVSYELALIAADQVYGTQS